MAASIARCSRLVATARSLSSNVKRNLTFGALAARRSHVTFGQDWSFGVSHKYTRILAYPAFTTSPFSRALTTEAVSAKSDMGLQECMDQLIAAGKENNIRLPHVRAVIDKVMTLDDLRHLRGFQIKQVMSACKDIKQIPQSLKCEVLNEMWMKWKSLGWRFDMSCHSNRIFLYSKFAFSEYSALELLKEAKDDGCVLSERNGLFFKQLIYKNSNLEEISQILAEATEAGVTMDQALFHLLFQAYITVGDEKGGSEILKQMEDYGFKVNESTYRHYLNGYALKGDLNGIVKAFEEGKSKGFEPYLFEIMSFAFHCDHFKCAERLLYVKQFSEVKGMLRRGYNFWIASVLASNKLEKFLKTNIKVETQGLKIFLEYELPYKCKLEILDSLRRNSRLPLTTLRKVLVELADSEFRDIVTRRYIARLPKPGEVMQKAKKAHQQNADEKMASKTTTETLTGTHQDGVQEMTKDEQGSEQVLMRFWMCMTDKKHEEATELLSNMESTKKLMQLGRCDPSRLVHSLSKVNMDLFTGAMSLDRLLAILKGLPDVEDSELLLKAILHHYSFRKGNKNQAALIDAHYSNVLNSEDSERILEQLKMVYEIGKVKISLRAKTLLHFVDKEDEVGLKKALDILDKHENSGWCILAVVLYYRSKTEQFATIRDFLQKETFTNSQLGTVLTLLQLWSVNDLAFLDDFLDGRQDHQVVLKRAAQIYRGRGVVINAQKVEEHLKRKQQQSTPDSETTTACRDIS